MNGELCPYCGREIVRQDWKDNNVFTHGGITFHGDCRRRALENTIKTCQKELQESLKRKK